MGEIITWLKTPIWKDGALTVWMIAAILFVVLIILLFCCFLRKKRKKTFPPQDSPTTQQPARFCEIEIANLQGLGNRSEQQDAFGLSPAVDIASNGLFAVLCDGMGGMAEGGRIARETVSELLSVFPWKSNDVILSKIRERSKKVYEQFLGHGGTTLVAAHIFHNKLWFWCVGDSDLFLQREGRLYTLNIRQEYRNDLLLRALDGAFAIEEIFTDPQAGALCEYIGKKDIVCETPRIPFVLQPEDMLLLCSDGISDTLSLKEICGAMNEAPQDCYRILEDKIISANLPHQDNYTAIILKYHKNQED